MSYDVSKIRVDECCTVFRATVRWVYAVGVFRNSMCFARRITTFSCSLLDFRVIVVHYYS